MRRFLASVGTAKLLGKKNGELYHIANVKTLTESALRFSTQAEEIRAGEGAQLYGKFFHSSKLEISLSDVMWDMNYISAIVGSDLSDNKASHAGLKREVVESAGQTISFSTIPSIIGNACGLNHAMVWMREVGCLVDDKWDCVELNKDAAGNYINQVNTPERLQGKNVCAEYFIDMPQTRAFSVGANFLPKEMVLILTTNLYAGSYNKVWNGRPVGSITVKIPRFQLDGTLDLSMAMNSVASTSLSGVALAVENNGCVQDGVYAEVVEIDNYSTPASGLVELMVDPDTQTAGDIPIVYGLYDDGHISVIEADDYDIDPPVDPTVGLIGREEYTVTVGDISTTFTAKMPDAYFIGNPIVFNSNNRVPFSTTKLPYSM